MQTFCTEMLDRDGNINYFVSNDLICMNNDLNEMA